MMDRESNFKQSSAMAACSLVFGIFSPIGLITCLAPLVSAPLAIILGHIALFKISKSDGRLTGRNRAIFGMALGYLFLPISVFLTYNYYSNLSQISQQPQNGSFAGARQKMARAEGEIVVGEGKTFGNSQRARTLAKNFGDDFSKVIRAAIVAEQDFGRSQAVETDVNVFCQVNEDGVCFLVKVPDLRNYDEDAKKMLGMVVWQIAQRTVVDDGQFPNDAKLGIGIKGVLLYSSVVTGTIDKESPTQTDKDGERLRAFFSD